MNDVFENIHERLAEALAEQHGLPLPEAHKRITDCSLEHDDKQFDCDLRTQDCELDAHQEPPSTPAQWREYYLGLVDYLSERLAVDLNGIKSKLTESESAPAF